MTSPIDTAAVAIVPDFSAFAREARQGIDAALRGVVSEVDRAFGAVERAAGETGADVGREFQQGGESAERALREVAAQAKRSFAQVDAEAAAAGSGMAAKLGGALGILKTGLIGAGIAAGTGLGFLTTFGLKSAAALEQTRIAFQSLLGSAEEGNRVFADLQKFAAVTPFEFTDVTPLAQKFLAFSGAVGLSKSQLQEFLTTAGNIVSVTGGGAQALDSIGLAFAHISSGGKVSLEDINILSDALPGFSGVAAIAAATGMSTGDAMKAISAGAIDATTGTQALLAGMAKFPGAAGAMEKQSQTLLGVFSTFKDTLSQALAGAFEPVIPAIKDSLAEATPILGEAIGKLAPALGSALSAILPLISTLVVAISPILKPLVDGIGVFVRTAGETGGLERLGEALGQIATALFPLFPVLGRFTGALADALIPAIEALVPQMPELVRGLVDLLTAITPILPALGFLLASIVELGKVMPGLLALITRLTKVDWGGIGDGISGAFSDALAAVSGFFEGIRTFFTALPGRIGAALAALPGLLVALATQAFDMFFTAIGFGIGVIVKAFTDLPATIAALVTLLWTTVTDLTVAGVTLLIGFLTTLPARVGAIVTDLWTRVKAFFAEGVESTVTTAKSLPDRILGVLKSLPGQMVQVGKNIIGGLIDGIKGAVGAAVDTVKRAMADIVNGAKRALGIASPSTVFADAVGAQIPAGIEAGIEAGVPSLQQLLGDVTAPTINGQGGAAGALGNVVINLGGIHFSGVVPTDAEARRAGAAAAAGAADALRRRDVALAVRQI